VTDATLILIDGDAELLRARALVDQLWSSNDPADVARLEAQARLIAAYEEKTCPVGRRSVADLIRHLMAARPHANRHRPVDLKDPTGILDPHSRAPPPTASSRLLGWNGQARSAGLHLSSQLLGVARRSRAIVLSSAAFSLNVTRYLGFATGGSGPSLVKSTGALSVGAQFDCAASGLACSFFIW
jgi:hypothetical protein